MAGKPPVVSRGFLDGQVCSDPECANPDCGPLVLGGRCHPGSGTVVEYSDGILSVYCRWCRRGIVSVAVEAGFDDPAALQRAAQVLSHHLRAAALPAGRGDYGPLADVFVPIALALPDVAPNLVRSMAELGNLGLASALAERLVVATGADADPEVH